MGVWLCCSSGESEALELPVCTHVELMTVLLVWVARSACSVAAVYKNVATVLCNRAYACVSCIC